MPKSRQHESPYVCMHLCMYVRMYVCMYVCTYVCMYVCMYVRMYVCNYMYRHTYVCIYIYTHTYLDGYLNTLRMAVPIKGTLWSGYHHSAYSTEDLQFLQRPHELGELPTLLDRPPSQERAMFLFLPLRKWPSLSKPTVSCKHLKNLCLI